MITYHHDIIQGTDEWHQLRLGLITASEMKFILTPTLKTANNEKTRAHVFELAAQRISQYVEPHYVGDEMYTGHDVEKIARPIYSENFHEVTECGFITRKFDDLTIGYSPDGIVGSDGLIEIKSRRQKFTVQTIIEGKVPDEHYLQCQAGLLISGRKWLDFITYCGGLPMMPIRVYPDEKVHAAIIEACEAFEDNISRCIREYGVKLQSNKWIETERLIEADNEIIIGGDE
jgi:hypothetical protein